MNLQKKKIHLAKISLDNDAEGDNKEDFEVSKKTNSKFDQCI